MKPYKCDECGKLYENADLGNDTLLCPSCGGRLQDEILDESTTDSDNVKNAWVCPKCRTRVNEFYLKCNCGYVTSREQVEQNKLDQQDYERVQTATKERAKAEAREKIRLAQQQVREQQRIERLTSLEKQKEDNKNQLKKRLAELKVLLDQTILTEEEYNKRRQPLLDKYFELNERIAREIENIDVSKGTEQLSESKISPSIDTSRNDSFLAEVEFIEDPPLPSPEAILRTPSPQEQDYTTNIPPAVVSPGEKQKRGIGGWLALLIFGMLFLGPCVSMGRVSSDFSNVEKQYKSLIEDPTWNQYKKTTWIVTIAFSAYMSLSGWLLYKRFVRSSVRNAKIAIWICGPLLTAIITVFVPAQYYGEKGIDYGSSLGTIIGSMFGATIWTVYLSLSKRVKATYIA